MILSHWNYFLAIEDDTDRLSRYVEFSEENFSVFSVEIARLLMSCTQETDVLLKQICQQHGDSSESEGGYRAFLSKQFPGLVAAEVTLARTELSFTPFASWNNDETPTWWSANNKVKHHRHTHFARASLQNFLNSLCALLLANLYFYAGTSKLDELWPDPKLLYPEGFVISASPTAFGLVRNYRVAEVSLKTEGRVKGAV